MADLFDRLFPVDGEAPRLSVHYFRAAMGDYTAGYTTRAQIIAFWELDAEAQADLNVLCNAIDGMTDLQQATFLLELHDVMMIAEAGAKYTDKASFRTRMGL